MTSRAQKQTSKNNNGLSINHNFIYLSTLSNREIPQLILKITKIYKSIYVLAAVSLLDSITILLAKRLLAAYTSKQLGEFGKTSPRRFPCSLVRTLDTGIARARAATAQYLPREENKSELARVLSSRLARGCTTCFFHDEFAPAPPLIRFPVQSRTRIYIDLPFLARAAC